MKHQIPSQRAILGLEHFISTPLAQKLEQHLHIDSQKIALGLFQDVVASVPAYQAFLAEQGINPRNIETLADFQNLPKINKENYISCYSLPQLCNNGNIGGCDMIAASSGSTGKATFLD